MSLYQLKVVKKLNQL